MEKWYILAHYYFSGHTDRVIAYKDALQCIPHSYRTDKYIFTVDVFNTLKEAEQYYNECLKYDKEFSK